MPGTAAAGAAAAAAGAAANKTKRAGILEKSRDEINGSKAIIFKQQGFTLNDSQIVEAALKHYHEHLKRGAQG